MLNKLNLILAEQLKDKSNSSLEAGVSRTLKNIVGTNKQAADIVVTDLQKESMSLTKCAEKLTKYAKNHKSGNGYYMTDDEAEQVIKEFYGLTELQKKPDLNSASLLDLMR